MFLNLKPLPVRIVRDLRPEYAAVFARAGDITYIGFNNAMPGPVLLAMKGPKRRVPREQILEGLDNNNPWKGLPRNHIFR